MSLTENAVKFQDNWNAMQGVSSIGPNQEANTVSQPAQPGHQDTGVKADIGRANLTGQNLRHDYAGPQAAPRGDMSYACSALGNQLKETIDSVLGAFSPGEPETGPAPETPPPVAKPQPMAFGI